MVGERAGLEVEEQALRYIDQYPLFHSLRHDVAIVQPENRPWGQGRLIWDAVRFRDEPCGDPEAGTDLDQVIAALHDVVEFPTGELVCRHRLLFRSVRRPAEQRGCHYSSEHGRPHRKPCAAQSTGRPVGFAHMCCAVLS